MRDTDSLEPLETSLDSVDTRKNKRAKTKDDLKVQEKQGSVFSVLTPVVLISALGYFVDIYDLLLFGIVRVASLKDLGVVDAQLMEVGIQLINLQMAGMLIGGILWGVAGDKKGRLSVLFGSILIYSVANILNAFVTSVEAYGVLRFFAGVGLAGELGAAITLVSESLSKEQRGWGTTLVAAVGILGGVFAGLVGDYFSWKTAYLIGGVMGLVLLVMRVSVFESGLFKKMEGEGVRRGDLRMLLFPGARFRKYLFCILIAVPIWYVIGILITFSPEFGRVLGVQEEIKASKAILAGYFGLSMGDFASGYLSQIFRSRKKIVIGFLLLTFSFVGLVFLSSGVSATHFYLLCLAMGFGTGYWAVFMTLTAEQFGTNLRATVTTTVPNFVRGSVVVLTTSFQFLQFYTSLMMSAALVGIVTFVVAMIAILCLEETYGKDLDYVER